MDSLVRYLIFLEHVLSENMYYTVKNIHVNLRAEAGSRDYIHTL